jgi:hypothetical protein
LQILSISLHLELLPSLYLELTQQFQHLKKGFDFPLVSRCYGAGPPHCPVFNSLLNKTYDIPKTSIHFKALKHGNQQFAGSCRKSWRFIVSKTNL